MSTFDVIIRGGKVVTPDGVRGLNVGISAGIIREMSPEIPGDAREVIDAAGLHVFPGVIDSHVHFNEPGRTEWEGIASGSSALAAGGGTCFFDMPLNSSPPVLDGETFDMKLEAMLAKSRTDFGIWGGLTPNNLDNLEELAERGVVGFKAFMSNSGIADFQHADDFTLFRGMEIAAKCGLLVAVHAENDAITNGLAAEAVGAGCTGAADYVASRPVVAEVEAIRRAIALSADAGCELHIVHVSSTQGALETLNAVHVTCETCPHYYTLTQDDLATLGAAAKCAPPLRDASNAASLAKLLRMGDIDFVASDHSPAPATMKTDSNFFKVWGGIAGVQSTLASLLSLDPAFDLQTVAAVSAANVARRFGVGAKGQIVTGLDADLALVDLEGSFTLRRDDLLDRHKLSPYVGRRFKGRVVRTLARGQTVFLNGKCDSTFRGRLVKPERGSRA